MAAFFYRFTIVSVALIIPRLQTKYGERRFFS